MLWHGRAEKGLSWGDRRSALLIEVKEGVYPPGCRPEGKGGVKKKADKRERKQTQGLNGCE